MLYDFICECGHKKMENIPMDKVSDTDVLCEKCGKKMTRNWDGTPHVVYKGTGFYATDYKPIQVGKDYQLRHK